MSLKQSLCISESPKWHLSRACVSQSPQNVTLTEFVYLESSNYHLKQSLYISRVLKVSLKAEFVYLRATKMSLKQSLCISRVLKLSLKAEFVYPRVLKMSLKQSLCISSPQNDT